MLTALRGHFGERSQRRSCSRWSGSKSLVMHTNIPTVIAFPVLFQNTRPLSKMKKTLVQLAEEFINGSHSIFSPSGSHRWLVCSGSLIPNLLAPNPTHERSAFGTALHEVTETWLRDGKKPRHLLGHVYEIEGFRIEIGEREMDLVRDSVDRCTLLPGDHFIERRVDFSRLTPVRNQGGTMDFAALTKGHGRLRDHKYGDDPVYAYKNPQLMLYALGIFYEFDWFYDFKKFTLGINQPTIGNFDEWECSRDELLEFAGYVKARAQAAWSLNAPRTPDPYACKHCAVRSTCAANIQMQFRLMCEDTAVAFSEQTPEEITTFVSEVEEDFLTPNTFAPLTLTTEHLENLWPFKKMVAKWWESLDVELLRRAQAGEQLRRVKPVEGRTHRFFPDVGKAVSSLSEYGLGRDDLVEEKMKSPAVVETLLREKGIKRKELPGILEGLTAKPPGKPTLASVSDKRQRLVDLSEVAFCETLDDESED